MLNYCYLISSAFSVFLLFHFERMGESYESYSFGSDQSQSIRSQTPNRYIENEKRNQIGSKLQDFAHIKIFWDYIFESWFVWFFSRASLEFGGQWKWIAAFQILYSNRNLSSFVWLFADIETTHCAGQTGNLTVFLICSSTPFLFGMGNHFFCSAINHRTGRMKGCKYNLKVCSMSFNYVAFMYLWNGVAA